MKKLKISAKNLISLCLILSLVLGMTLTGCKKNTEPEGQPSNDTSTDTADTAQTGTDAADKGNAADPKTMYEDFMAGKYMVDYPETDGLLLEEFLAKILEEENQGDRDLYVDGTPEMTELSYAIIDCGLDGIPELALLAQVESCGDIYSDLFVIKAEADKLQIVYKDSSTGYFNTTLFADGLLTKSAFFGTSQTDNSYYYLDATGTLNLIYNETTSYSAPGILDKRFGDHPSSEVPELKGAYLKAFNFTESSDYDDSQKWAEQRMYCAEKDDDEPSNGVDFAENEKVIRKIFDKYGLQLYHLSQIKDKIAKRKAELGLTQENEKYTQIDWKAVSVDLASVNEAFFARYGGQAGQSGIPLESDEDITEFLTGGTWLYFEPGTDVDTGDASLSIAFEKDGSFRGVRSYNQANLNYNFDGHWCISNIYGDENQLANDFFLDFTNYEDPEYSDSRPFGDYLLQDFGIMDGRYVMALHSRGVNDGLFGRVANPVLYKTGVPKVETPESSFEPNLIHEVNLWRAEPEGDKTAFWVSYGAEGYTSGIYGLTKLYGYDEDNSEYPFDAFADNGISHVFVTLTEAGNIDNISPVNAPNIALTEEVSVLFDPGDTIRSYVIKQYDYTVYSPEGGRVLAYFERPVLGGYGKVVDGLNKDIETLLESYKKGVESNDFKDMCQSAFGLDPTGEFMYSPYELNGVYTNDDYVSICFNWDWCMGGVYNEGSVCLNRNLNTGEKVTLDELMGIPMKSVKDKIAEALYDQYGDSTEVSKEYFRSKIDGMDDFTFHFDSSQIFVVFESYALDLGTSSFMARLEY